MDRIYPYDDVSAFAATTDVLIAGFGGAGASAALEARRAGADVVVLERASGGGGCDVLRPAGGQVCRAAVAALTVSASASVPSFGPAFRNFGAPRPIGLACSHRPH